MATLMDGLGKQGGPRHVLHLVLGDLMTACSAASWQTLLMLICTAAGSHHGKPGCAHNRAIAVHTEPQRAATMPALRHRHVGIVSNNFEAPLGLVQVIARQCTRCDGPGRGV